MSPTPLAGVPRVPPSPAPHRQRFGRGGGGRGRRADSSAGPRGAPGRGLRFKRKPTAMTES